MQTKLDSALALAARGFKVFPLKPGAKTPPLVKDWPARATSDAQTINAWWHHWPEANIGIHCDGMIVVDVDPRKGGDSSLALLEMTHGIPDTLTARTPTGGLHLFFRHGLAVPNSVAVLGDGLDIRSAGGYVVAAGSTVAAGEYRFQEDAAVVDAPDWLVAKLGTAAPKGEPPKPVADAADDVVERARAWLKTAERSVKGAGGDQTAYRVACALRDRGVSYLQACELMRSEAWDYGCGWRDGRLEDKPIRSAYKYAQNTEPGTLAISADDFPIIKAAASDAPKIIAPGRPKTLAELAAGRQHSAGYLVKGLLHRRSHAVFVGQPGEGKTFVALDLCYHVAAGTEWLGRRVRQGSALYLAYEAFGGLTQRALALRQKYGTKDVPLYVHPANYNLREEKGRRALGELLATLPEKPALIVIDTLAHALCGGDENSAQDTSAFNAAVSALIENTGACVLILHHPPKSGSGQRGSSALLGAVDTEIEIADKRIRPTKQRDIAICEPLGFQLVPLVVGLDEDGDDETSCVVEPGKVVKHGTKVSGDVKRAFDVLCELRPDNKPLTMGEWHQGCEAFGATHKKMYDVRLALKRAQLVDINEDGTIQRRMT